METTKRISTLYDFARHFQKDVEEMARVRLRLENVNCAIVGPFPRPVESEADGQSQDGILTQLNDARDQFLNELKEMTNEIARLENVVMERKGQEIGGSVKLDSVRVG